MHTRSLLCALAGAMVLAFPAVAKHRAVGCGCPVSVAPFAPAPSIGSVAATVDPDPDHSVTMHVTAESVASGSVDTADGTTWSLYIPAGAVAEPIDVTMRPYAEVHTTGGTANVVSGVKFEPFGLQFGIGAYLIVATADGLPADVVTFDDDGANLRPARMDAEGARIFHFSGAGRTNPPLGPLELDPLLVSTLKAADDIIHDQTRPLYPPGLPKFHPDCKLENKPDRLAIAQYLFRFFEPEEDLVVTLRLPRLGNPDPDRARLLLDRLANGATAAINAEKSGADHGLDALETLTQIMARLAVDIGSETRTQAQTDAFRAFDSFVSTIANDQLNDVITKHDFRAIRRVQLAAEQMARVHAPTGDWLGKLDRALRWEAQFNYSIATAGSSAYSMSATTPSTLLATGDFTCNGTNNLCRAGNVDAVYSGHAENDTATADRITPKFNATIMLEDYEPCDGTATVRITALVPGVNPWLFCEKGKSCVPSDRFGPVAQGIAIDAFEAAYIGNGEFRFTGVHFRNGDPTTIDDTITGNQVAIPEFNAIASSSIHIQMVHVPQP